jgi:DNA-directed RNA polymerase subunit RPC12/RpoP
MKREVEGRKMQATKLFTIDLTKIRGKGDFNCPKCGVKISPNEKTEKTYRILEAVMQESRLEGIMLQCSRCDSQIHLTGFRALNMTR